MNTGYEIVGYEDHGEAKRIKGQLPWVALHTDQGLGYCKLWANHGPKGWGIWTALLMLTARRSKGKRGEICGTDEEIALMLRADANDLQEVLGTLEEIGWVSQNFIGVSPGDRQGIPENPPDTLQDRTVQDRTGQDTQPTPKLPSNDGMKLAQFLYDSICSHTPDFKADGPKLLGWAKTFDVELRKKGGYSATDMKIVIDWAHVRDTEGFWHGNLLSGTKVRKHMAKLLIRARQADRGPGRSVKDLLNEADLLEGFPDARS